MAGVYVGQFLFLGVQLPFLAGLLDARGFAAPAIGLMTGASLVLRLVLAPMFAYRVDTLPNPQRALWLTTAILCGLSALLLWPLSQVAMASVVVALLVVFGLVVPLTDAAALRADQRGELQYGAARGVGSVSFIIASVVGGMLVARFGDAAVVPWLVGAATFSTLSSFRMPRERAHAVGRRPTPSQALSLVRSRVFVLMLLSCGLVQGAHATYYGFSKLHWTAAGHSSAFIGQLWAVGVVAEVALLLGGRRLLSRLSPATLIAMGAAAAIPRWLLTGMSPSPLSLVGLQALHALTFAATHLGCMAFVERAVPGEYRTTALTVISTCGTGAVTGAATVVAGYLFDPSDPFAAYLLMSAMGGLGLLLALVLRRVWRGGPLHCQTPQA